jgi:hypothetical protein
VYQEQVQLLLIDLRLRLQSVPSFGFPPTFEEVLLVSDTEALANEARPLKLIEQGHGIIFG